MTTSSYNHYFIPVDISKGMFSSEYSVSLKLADGNTVSFFADRDLFKQEKDKWLMRVALVSQDKDKALVLLPVEPFETASRWAEVMAA